ncbi:MAG: lipocalin family protein [Acidobacteriota bacterium]
MKTPSLFHVLLVAVAALSSPADVLAQKSTYDLVTFTPPSGWQKDVKDNSTLYTAVDQKSRNWCRIGIVKSTISKGTIERDFASEWQELMVRNYKISEVPQAPKTGGVRAADGWAMKAGGGTFTFENGSARAMLTTMSGFGRCVSIVVTTNSDMYARDIEAFLSSVELNKPDMAARPDPATQPVAGNAGPGASIVGTWGTTSSDQSAYAVNNGINGYITRQYTFSADGTYVFYIKTFQYYLDKLLLTRERGTYLISGNTIRISPQQSVIEAWSKKDDADKWGRLLTTETRTLETTTYQFTKHYFSGVQTWSLVLQADKVTQRDGPFSGGTAFKSAWIYSPPCSQCYIELPK